MKSTKSSGGKGIGRKDLLQSSNKFKHVQTPQKSKQINLLENQYDTTDNLYKVPTRLEIDAGGDNYPNNFEEDELVYVRQSLAKDIKERFKRIALRKIVDTKTLLTTVKKQKSTERYKKGKELRGSNQSAQKEPKKERVKTAHPLNRTKLN